jgi:penicillin-binding protein 1A
MTEVLQRLRARTVELAHRTYALARKYPLRTALTLPALLLLYALILIPFTPSISDLRKAREETPSKLVSSDGVVLAEYRRINRQWVPLDKISPHVVDALIATEDRRFYEHHGIDLRRTVGAVFRTLQGDTQGGSTLTQQLARNMYPEEIGRSISLHRKAKELITAFKIEATYSKPEILETYLNTVPFLYNAFGIEMAARTYFDKTADKLDVLEAATLVGMLKGTAYYNPVQQPERARQRRNTVLEQLAVVGKLKPEQVATLSKRPLRLDFERQDEALGIAPHVAQQLKRWLIAWADRHDRNIFSDGLVVRTTIDAKMQKAANAAVAKQIAQLQQYAEARVKKGQDKPQLQAGFLAVDPRNGYVRAWVGSRDFATEQFDHVNQARRQPGSTFKPFVYGAAFMMGISPEQTFVDEPVTISLGGNQVWQPTDDSAPTYMPMTLREGLAYSKNIITAQLMQQVGAPRVAQLARALGVRQSKLEEVPSLALGTSPVTLREMVAAYGSIANGGWYYEPMLVLRVEDKQGNLLEQFAEMREAQPAMPRGDSLTLVNAMRGTIDEGTGAAMRYRWGITADLAGKTGTTQDNTDGWFIAMHPQLVAGARVGFNDQSIHMGSWGQGARGALPMVGEVFSQALRNKWIDPRNEFDIPRPVPKPKPEPEAASGQEGGVPVRQPGDAIGRAINDLFGKIFRGLQ